MFKVVAGSILLKPLTNVTQIRTVSQIFIHPHYDVKTLNNDIAILKVFEIQKCFNVLNNMIHNLRFSVHLISRMKLFNRLSYVPLKAYLLGPNVKYTVGE